MNVGFALGALVAGAIARTAHPSTFTFLFLLNAVTFLVFVVVLQFVPSTRHREERREPGRYADVARNRVFISYVFLNVILIGAGIAVMSELLPPFAKNTAHVSEPAIGVIWFVFSAVVALGQLPVVKLVEGKRRLRGLALMGVVWAGAFLGVLAGGAWFTGNQAAIVFGGCRRRLRARRVPPRRDLCPARRRSRRAAATRPLHGVLELHLADRLLRRAGDRRLRPPAQAARALAGCRRRLRARIGLCPRDRTTDPRAICSARPASIRSQASRVPCRTWR